MQKKIGIIGAGPAGLTAAYLLAKAGQQVIVFESDPKYVGGISRTESYKGYLFDIGGHRFFSKSKEVEDFWTEILSSDMLDRPRSSRIYYKSRPRKRCSANSAGSPVPRSARWRKDAGSRPNRARC